MIKTNDDEEHDDLSDSERTSPEIQLTVKQKQEISNIGSLSIFMNYDETSKRNQPISVDYCKVNNNETHFEKLENWKDSEHIYIDGMSGCGKSTLIRSMNRAQAKINMILPDLTRGPAYNVSVMHSMIYFTLMNNIESFVSQNIKVCWDRGALSNLIFYFVHHLSAIMMSDRITTYDEQNCHKIFNELAKTINLCSILDTFKQYDKKIIFIVNSKFDLVSMALVKRGGKNDIHNATDEVYLMSQYQAYVYFAKLLDCPIFNLEFVKNIGDFIFRVRSLVDVDSKQPDLEFDSITKRFHADRKLIDLVEGLDAANEKAIDLSIVASRK